MSFGAELATSSRVSKRLTAATAKDLAALVLRAESPIASAQVVGPLMEMLVGGPLDLQGNYTIQEPSIFLLLFELLPHFTEQLQVEVWGTLVKILQLSLSNIQSCRQLRLIERCLGHLRSTPGSEVAALVVKVIGLVGGYSVSLKELQDMLSYLYTGQNESWVGITIGNQHRVLETVLRAFQQRLFHPNSNLDGYIVLELGKIAAKTGDSATVDELSRLMELSLGESAQTTHSKEKKNSHDHIYQPLVNSLVYVANHLRDKEESRKLMLKSLQLFVQQGINAKKASDKADATHKATSSSFSLGLMLPVIATLMKHIEPIREPKLGEMKLFRDFWLYCIVMGFSDFQIGVFPSAWYDNIRQIALKSPLLLSMGADQYLDKELEVNHPLNLSNIAPGELQEARQSFTDKVGRSPELDKLVSRLTFVQCMYLISIYRLESLRLEQNSKVFADFFLYLEDRGLHGELWVAIEMIANKLFEEYMKQMEAKPANSSRAAELEELTQLLLFKFINLRGRIKKVADRYLAQLVDKFSHLLWSKRVIHTMLDLVQELSLMLHNMDQSTSTSVTIRLPYLSHSAVIPDDMVKREKTVSYFATRCQEIIELAMKWTPLETKTILEDYICQLEPASTGLSQHAAVSLAASIISKHYDLNTYFKYLPSGVHSRWPACLKNTLSQPFSKLFLRSRYLGEVEGMRTAWQLGAGVLKGADRDAVKSLSEVLIQQLKEALAGSCKEQLTSAMYRATALLICSETLDRTLLYSVTQLPVIRFTELSISVAMNCWQWLISSRPDLEYGLMREFAAAWKWTVEERKGIFMASPPPGSLKANQRAPPIPVRQHLLLIKFLADRLEVIKTRDGAQVCLMVEILHQSLMLGVGPTSLHPQLISHAPEATTARFRLLSVAVSILQHKLVSSALEQTILRERIYNTTLDFFAYNPMWPVDDVVVVRETLAALIEFWKSVRELKNTTTVSQLPMVAVVFQKRIMILDAGSLESKFTIKNNYPSAGFPCNPIALGTRWLAYSETKLSSKHQSIGGMSHTTTSSMATTMLKNVRKGISALTETISGLTSKAQGISLDPAEKPQETTMTGTGVVTVIDTSVDWQQQEVRLQDLGVARPGAVVAHFVAHAEAGVHIAALAFNHSGSLLVSASTEGNTFHVFQLLPHPFLSSETAVHHLYTLYRGATSGVVQDIVFSSDSRWVTVSTLNGTSHVFPVSPYGGEPTVRTHTSAKVVNKMSRFHTSAGMDSIAASQFHSHNMVATSSKTLMSRSSQSHVGQLSQSPPSPASHRETPALPVCMNGYNSWSNPRSLPLPTPIIVTALQQIKQPYQSSSVGGAGSKGSGSRGEGVSVSVSSSRTELVHAGEPGVTLAGPDAVCVRAVFGEPSHGAGQAGTLGSVEGGANYCLYVLGGNGTLVEHHLTPLKLPSAPEGEDAPIELIHSTKLCWRLLGHPVVALGSMPAGSVPLPLKEDNPLIAANNLLRTLSHKNDHTLLSSTSSSSTATPHEFTPSSSAISASPSPGHTPTPAVASSPSAATTTSASAPSPIPSPADDQWLSQVEILTHAPPSRRLWMGPQFSFKPYQSPPTSCSSPSVPSSGSGADLIKTPSPPNTIIYSGSLNSSLSSNSISQQMMLASGKVGAGPVGGEKGVAGREEQSAVLFPCVESPLLDVLTESPATEGQGFSINSSPLSVPGSKHRVIDSGMLEIIGSWSKVTPHYEGGTFEGELERQLEDAMGEQEAGSITIISRENSRGVKTGFSPPGP